MSFRDASAVSPVDDSRFRGEIAEGWDIVGNANGGYVMATAARAMSTAADRPDPLTITAHYLRPVTVGPVDIVTEVVRSGRRVSTVRGRLERDGAPLVEFLGAFGDLASETRPDTPPDTPRYSIIGPPDVPPVEECFAMTTAPDEERKTAPPSFTSRVEMHLHPDDAGFTSGAPSGVARIRGWFRLAHDEPLDSIAVLLAADAFPPTVFNADLPIGWTPTIELTVHVRRRPVATWLRCSFETSYVADGVLDVSGALWDDSDNLVAQSRQIALVARG